MAYGPPRYSQDVDLVCSAGSAPDLHRWLSERGLRRRPNRKSQDFSGSVTRYESEDLTLDLLEKSVRDREAKVDLPAEWIEARARALRLTTINSSTNGAVRVARPEALWALKLQAGRDIDLSDLFAINAEPLIEGEIVQLFRSLMNESLGAKFRKVDSMLESRKLLVDSLTRRALGSPELPKNQSNWTDFVRRARRIIGASLE